MKLAEMSPAQLRKRADKWGVKYSAKTSDQKLVRLIKKAKAAKGIPKNAKAANPTEVASFGEEWPDEWPEEMRDAYFLQIVKKPMPDDPTEAYRQLRVSIEEQAPEVEPIRLSTGYSCYGLWYSPDMKMCNAACQVMPLCKHVCSTRPGLKDQVAQLEQAAQKIAKSAKTKTKKAKPPAEKEQPEAVVAPKKKKKKSKPAAERYRWVGDLEEYDTENADEDDMITFQIFGWMSEQKKGFTQKELAEYMEEHYEGDGSEAATSMIEALKEQGEVALAEDEAAA